MHQSFFSFKSPIVESNNLFIIILFGGEEKMKILPSPFFISPKRSLKVMVNVFPKSVIAELLGYAG